VFQVEGCIDVISEFVVAPSICSGDLSLNIKFCYLCLNALY